VSADISIPDTAAGIRRLNTELDQKLIDLARSVDANELLVDPLDGEWTVAQNLAHIGEFPTFFAVDLGRWIDDPTVVVGRTHDHPVRNDAIAAADSQALTELVGRVERSLATLAGVLERLEDHHLDVPMRNVKYGDESIADYLRRYVLGHKAAHIDQLDRTLARVRELRAT
jgi:hypothetical protein